MVQREGDWVGPQPAQAPPSCTKCNSPPISGQCTNHRIKAYHYNGPLLCGFNVAIKQASIFIRPINAQGQAARKAHKARPTLLAALQKKSKLKKTNKHKNIKV